MNSTSLDPKSLRAASLTGRDTDRGPGVNNFFSLPGELTATVYRLKININVSFFKNPIFITNIYNYSIKLQVIIIFYFYHFDTHELMSQEKRSFLILYVGQWVYIFFYLEKLKHVLQFSSVYSENALNAYIVSSIFLSCVTAAWKRNIFWRVNDLSVEKYVRIEHVCPIIGSYIVSIKACSVYMLGKLTQQCTKVSRNTGDRFQDVSTCSG